MDLYPTYTVLHIIFAGLWLANILAALVFNKAIKAEEGHSSEGKLIKFNLVFSNLLGSIGAMGLLITGIALASINPSYGFFDFSANHWLATKQIIMVILFILIFTQLIPYAKKARLELEKEKLVSSEARMLFGKVKKITLIINVLVILNFLFAITHRFIG